MNKFSSILLLLAIAHVCLHGEIREVTILQTTDIHAARDVAKLTTVLLEEKANIPPNQMLLIDCGDLTLGSFDATLDQGKTMIDYLNTLSYDVFIPGNHDFDYGTDIFCRNMQNIRAKVLCANLLMDKKAISIPPWTMFERNGVKIAVIGFSIPHLDMWIPAEIIPGINLLSLPPSLEKIMPEIRKAHPDVIILAAHVGHLSAGRLTNQKGTTFLNSQLRIFPEISLVLGGHTHQDIPGEIILKNTMFVQAPHHARGYAKTIIQYDTKKKQVKNISSTLRFVNADILETDISTEWRKNIEEADVLKKKQVANVPFPLTPLKTPKTPCPLATLFAEAMANATGTTCGFSSTYTSVAVPQGIVTEEQVFDLIPYENYICVLSLNPSEVRQIIEEQMQLSSKKSAIIPFGVSFQYAKSGKITGPLIKNSDGSEWTNESDRMDFAFSSYDVCSAGGRFPTLKALTKKREAKYRVTKITLRDAFRDLLRKKYP